jgi:hypothetical protein
MLLYFRSKQYKVFLQGFLFCSSRCWGHILWYMGVQFRYWCLLKVVYWMCDCAKLTFAGIATFSSSWEDDSFGPLCWCEACLVMIKSLLWQPLHLVNSCVSLTWSCSLWENVKVFSRWSRLLLADRYVFLTVRCVPQWVEKEDWRQEILIQRNKWGKECPQWEVWRRFKSLLGACYIFWKESGDVWAAWCGGCRPYWSIDQSKFYNGSFSQLLRPIFQSQNLFEWLTSR